MSEKVSIAVVGATGAVGEVILEILHQRAFPAEKVFALASERSAGDTVMFGNKPLMVENLASFDFSQVQIALFSAGGAISKEYAPKAAEAGCVVIDNTSEFRYDDDIPLVVPEVNPEAIAEYKNRNIIANPNCSTIQMVVALKPIFDAVGIDRINVATYQAVSGAGSKGVKELAGQTATLLNGQGADPEAFSKQIAFNVIPHIDSFQDNGYTREEMKMVWETKKILGDDQILVNPTCVRVPVFYGHSEAVHIETTREIELDQVEQLLSSQAGVALVDKQEDGGYATPVSDAAGEDLVYVSRVRKDISHDRGLNLWIVSDNLRKGAALNSVQIAEFLLKSYF